MGARCDPIKSFAIVFWAVSFIPVTLVGIFCLWREGLSIAELYSSRQEDETS